MKHITLTILLLIGINCFAQEHISEAIINNEKNKIEVTDYCKDITHIKDKFSNKNTYSSPFGNQGLKLIKVKENNTTYYYLSISVRGSTLNIGEKGAYILFENGKKIIRSNEEIDVESSDSNGWIYSVFFTLSKEHINLLKNHRITDVKLFIYENEIDLVTSEKIKEYMKCLTK